MNKKNFFTLLEKSVKPLQTLVVYLIIFQIFTQPAAVLARSQNTLQAANTARSEIQNRRSNIKPKAESSFADILPNLENKTRRAVSNALGVDIPFPQVFGENGKLNALFAGKNSADDKNRELIESAFGSSGTSNTKAGQSNAAKSAPEAAVSLNAPVLNSGSIDGSLRVLKEIPFNLNENFSIGKNLYTVGSPGISTGENSQIKNVVNDEGDDLFNEYKVHLNGGKIGGDIFIHSSAENIFEGIPSALPKPSGSENVEINSAADLKAIKDWKSVRSLTINAENLTVEIPAGNYERLTVNTPNKIIFSHGTYNFSDTINLQKGGAVEIAGDATIGIGNNLFIEDGSIKVIEKNSPENLKINILGNSVVLSGKSEIGGLLRALNANVVINENSKVSGQVIAGSLVMNGGTISGLPYYAPADNIAVVSEGFTLDGRIEGSVQQRLAQNTILNSGAVITGDLLVPGVPQLTQNGAGNFGGTVTGTGSATPTTHRITLNSSTTLRKLKNRIDPVTMPTVPTPPASSGTQSITINNSSQYPANFSNIKNITMNSGAGVMTLPPGNYGTISINSGSGVKLGTAGQTTPVTYNLSSFTINGGSQIQVVSPVIINLGLGLNLNANLGVPANPEWLKVNVASGSVNINSNSNLYGGLIAPTSNVTINAGTSLIGNVVCKKIIVNSNGLLKNVLPNLLSDTSVSIASPANNSTTTNNLITVTGTAQSSVGIANVSVNNQAASYNSSNGSWTISNVALAVGANTITAKAVDSQGTEATTQITVTRQQPVADTTPPAISISSPINNSNTQSATITVSGNAADPGTNPSGVATVKVNGQNATLTPNGNWTISGIALNNGSNTITARATDNAGNYSDAVVTVVRQTPDTTPPTLSIGSPANGSETTDAAISVSGTVSDAGENPSGVASVTVNGQAATVNGNGWTIPNIALTIGANTITVNAIDNAGNSSSQQITVTRKEADTTAPTIAINSPANNSETNETSITISGTATDPGANASGVATVTVNGQNAGFNNGSWTLGNVALSIGSNTITVRATDNAGNEGTASLVIIRREPDTTAPTVSINSPADNSETLNPSVTVSGTVVDSGANASGVASVIVNGIGAIITGSTWTAENVPLNTGSNTITATAKDNNNNSSNTSITVVRIPPDTTAPTITITSPANNSETFDPQITVSGTVVDEGAGATGIQSVVVNGVAATYDGGSNSWTATVNLNDGVNTITAVATDNAPTPHQSQAAIQVAKLVIQPPTLSVTNPQNGAFLSANSVTVAGSVASNKPDMTFTVAVNGQTVNLAGREFAKTLGLTEGANVITVLATDALGQQAQESLTVTNDRTPPTVFLTNVPQVVNPGESYTIGATAFDTYGISDVEFTINGASVTRSSVSPYLYTLNIPLNQTPNETLNISAIARDNAGLSATATARIITSGPSGLTGYVFDDATGYVLPETSARLNVQNPLLTDENGLYSFISTSASGNVLLSKNGYTTIERGYTATAGSGVEVFDARLTPLDSKVNTADANGSANASNTGGKIQLQFAPNSFPAGTDIRVTEVSPQGLANLLPYGWSPIPGAVVDIRTADETGFSNRNFSNPANLTITQLSGLTSNIPVVLAKYDGTAHKWIVLQRDLFAVTEGTLQTSISTSGQFAFLVADTGATAPPSAVNGQELPTSAPANSEQLNSATANAFASPATALYSNTAKSRINFLANSAVKLPSGISIEASFNDTYLTIIDRSTLLIDRPSQDFVLYSYPSVSVTEPNKLGAYFVAKPIRTDFGLSDLLNAKIHVDIRSGRLAQTGILIGQTGGTVRGQEGSELEIPGGTVNSSQIVFFNKIPNDQTGVILPPDYEIVGAFDINLAGNSLSQTAKISMPAVSGDYSKLVVAKVISIGGQQGLKVVARAVENNSRFESTVAQPSVPAGVNLTGIRDGGKYLFVKMPGDFGYIKGTVSSSAANTQTIKISNIQTPFVDVAANNGTYTILGLANGVNNQVDAVSLNNDATGIGTTALASQDNVSNLPISLASSILSVQNVTPLNGAANVVVTTPVTVTFNKPILSSTVTGSNIKLVTANGNPVITTITMLAGNRSVVLTPSSNLQSETDYKVKVSGGIKDIYGNALANAFESGFRTANLVTVSNQLQPSQIRISYPNEQGICLISIPAGAVPNGSLIFAINNSNGNTVSTVAGSGAIEISIQARVGEEIELIIRQPDGSEYRVKQAAYRRADGFVSVGSNGGTITSDDGTLLLQVPAGAISGQADLKLTFAPESAITAPRPGEMAPGEMNYIGGVKIEAQGNYTNTEELHLELPAPANIPEGQRALVMKPSRINPDGTEIDTWETVTSAKVENGKIKTTSPPFLGVTLPAVVIGLSLSLAFFVFIPIRQRVVTGLVRKQKSDGTYEIVNNGNCFLLNPANERTQISAQIQSNGKFTLSHNLFYVQGNQDVLIECVSSTVSKTASAFPYNGTEPGLSGFETRYANVIFPPDSTVNQPPQINLVGSTLGNNGEPVPETDDLLKRYGKVQAGSRVRFDLSYFPFSAQMTSQLIINGVAQNLGFECQNVQTQNNTTLKACGTAIQTSGAGRYSVVVKAQTVPSDPSTVTIKTLDFNVLNNPNVRPSISGVNPAVVSVSPVDGANQIDVGTSIHVEFSEPVKNLRSGASGETVYLLEDGLAGERIGGKMFSGGLPVTETSEVSVMDFVPNRRLKSGKKYKLFITTQVIDLNKGDATANPPIPADPDNLRRLDQNPAVEGLQEFTSSFNTFQGRIITPTPINAQGYKVAVLDDYVIATRPFFNGIASSGTMDIYDSSEFLGTTGNQNLQPVANLFIPHVPIGLAAKKQTLTIAGQTAETYLIAVTTLSVDTARPRNVWFYRIDENRQIRLVGVVSLLANGNGGQVPNSISIEGKRAYIGSSSNGGVYVVDIQQAIDEFSSQDDTPNDGNEYNNIPTKGAVSAPGQPYAGGFGISALMQRATYLNGNDQFLVYGVSTITQLNTPFTYTTSSKQKFISFGFSRQTDGRIGFMAGGANGTDARVAANLDSTPVSGFADIKAVAGLQIQGMNKDIAVGVVDRLFIFDVTDPGGPKQLPVPLQNESQKPAKTFTELGVPSEFGSYGKQVEIEGTLVYVMFDNGVAVFDISNPEDPYLTTLIRGLSGLRYMAVQDGYIYTLGSNGLNVSIGRAVSQVITYGYNPNSPDDVCGNPVVIRRDNNKMAQPVGIFFQVFGRDTPNISKVIIRKVEITGGVRTEQVIGTTTDVQILSSTADGTTVGRAKWGDTDVEIDTSAIYTAQIVLDEDTNSSFNSKQFEIPFSYLIPEGSYQQVIKVTSDWEANNQDGTFSYLLAGTSTDVNLKIQTENIVLRNRPGSTGGIGEPKSERRPFGQNLDFFRLQPKRADGTYSYTFSATLDVTPRYTEQVTGTVQIGSLNENLRKPGSTVVNGVEINSGNLALSENEITVKGRGLSLDYTRSYNSQSANSFGTLGYGWQHSYQISLTKRVVPDAAGNRLYTEYRIAGGEGSNQSFREYPNSPSLLNGEAPYLGKFRKNTDGSFDYLTKSQTKYHFQSAFDESYNKVFYGNLRYIEEPNGNRITLGYDSDGKLLRVTDSSNRSLIFEYEIAQTTLAGADPGEIIPETEGCPSISQYRRITRRIQQSLTEKVYRVSKVTAPGGAEIAYTYDEDGNLETATRQGFDSISDATGSKEWRYDYYAAETGNYTKVHLLKTAKSPNNAASGITAYSYYFGTTTPPRVMSISMPEGVSNSFVYDNQTNTDVINRATFTDGRGNQTRYELTNGRVETITAPLGAVTRLEWTDFGQIKKTTDPEGKVTEIIFDENNNPATQTQTGSDGYSIQTVTTFDPKFSKMDSFRDGNGNTTTYSINQTNGNVDEIALPSQRNIVFRYFPNGDLKEVTDQYATKTEFSDYDSYGNPQTITKQLGGGQAQIISQTFDVRSRQRSKSDNLGTDMTMTYDALDRVVSETASDPAGYRNTLKVETTYLPEGQPSLIVQKDGNTELNRTQNTYDKLQRLKKTVETVSGYGAPFTRNFTYDFNSNLLTEQNRRGITTVKSYNALNHLTKIEQGGKAVWEATEINKVGNPKTVLDLFGNQTVYIYDGLQRLKEKQLPESATEKLIYDANNNITDSFDRNGNKTHYTYDSMNRVETVTDALNRVTRWTYADAEHKVTKETVSRSLTETTVLDGLERPTLQTIRFGGTTYQTSYNYNGRNVSMTDPRSTVTNIKLSGFGETGETEVVGANPAYKTNAFYTALGGIRQMTDASNRVTNCVNDGFDRKRSININGEYSENWNYDGEGLVTSHTDRRNILTEMTYDELGRNLTATRGGIEVSKITYADANNIETKESAVNAAGSRNPVEMKYDGLRRVKEITNADGNKKSFTYNGENLLEETDFFNQAERKTKYVYDKLNRVREIYDRTGGQARIDYSANDLVKTTTDRRGKVTTENYDALGRLTAADSYGKLVSYTYDGNGNRLTQQDGLNNQTAFEYDKLNRLTAITHAGGLQTELFTYDAVGNLKTHNDGRGGVTENLLYDSLDQLKRAKDGAGNISEFQYDGAGLLRLKKDPKQNVTTYNYNALGSLTQIAEPEQAPWTLTYDSAQNLTSITDPLSRVTAYEYDAQNRLTKTKQPLGRTTVYEYDKNSNIRKITDPKGQVTEMIYTALDNPDTVTYKDESNAVRITHQFAYDAEENPWRITENRNGASRTYTREYDNRNRLTAATDAYNKTVSFGYDNANNLTTLTDAANRRTTYNYDAKNQLDTVTQNGTGIADYDWYADGLLKKVAYQNQTSRNYVYDDADRVSTVTNNFAGSQNESYDYIYDNNSNRTREVRRENGIAKRTAVYDYDALDRLTKADYTVNVQEPPTPPLGSQAQYVENTNLNSYVYDAVGNRTSERTKAQSKTVTISNTVNGVTRSEQTDTSPEQTTTATFNALNELTQLNEPTGASDFTYDPNGNLSEIKKGSVVINKYEYDVRNQLSRALDGSNNELARFDYDFERKRLSKTNSYGTTNYVYAGNQVVNETQNNAFTASYTIGGGEIVRSEFSNGENNFHFTDALGSVTALAGTNGSLTSRSEYDAFGLQSSSSQTANSIGYTGQRLDNETGLMALGNGERYYSPVYARFIQQDSWLGDNAMPQSLNRFSYGYNNPFKYTDPSGNEGVVADSLHDFANSSAWDTGNETLDWWTRAGRNFVAGVAYDSINLSTFGRFGSADRNLQKAMRGEQITVSDMVSTNWYGGNQDGWNPGNLLKNEAIGFAHGAYKLVTGVVGLAAEYNPVTQVYRSYQFLKDPVGEAEKKRQAANEMWAGVKQWASDLYGGVTNPGEVLKAAEEVGPDKTGQILGEAEFDAAMIVDAGAGAVKGGKAYMAMRTAKLERQALQVAIKESVETSFVGNGERYKMLDIGGLRNEVALTAEQSAEAVNYAKKLGMPEKIAGMDFPSIKVSESMNTSWGPMFNKELLYIGPDVLPSLKTGLPANSRISMKGALAHEIVGHREAALAGRTNPNLILEEAQASIRAARFGPELSLTERVTLLRDAVTRLRREGIKVKDVKDQLFINER